MKNERISMIILITFVLRVWNSNFINFFTQNKEKQTLFSFYFLRPCTKWVEIGFVVSTSLINKLYWDVDTIIKMVMLGLRHVFEHINTTSQLNCHPFLRHVFEHINTTSQLNCHPFLNRNFYSCLCWAQKLDYLAPNSIVELASFYMFLSKLINKITLFIYLFLFCI